MATVSPNELEEIFIDVRKAYRLLYLYQRRVLDTIGFISSTLSKPYVEGHTLFSNSHKNQKQIHFHQWAWDWLPMFCYEFKFAVEEIKDSKYQFSVILYSDNGFEEAGDMVTHTNVEEFYPVEISQTQIYFQLWKNVADWNEDYDILWRSESTDKYEHSENDTHFLSQRFNLSSFDNEDNIIGRLREFKEYCREKGISDFFTQNF
jgi:hypothetical protein